MQVKGVGVACEWKRTLHMLLGVHTVQHCLHKVARGVSGRSRGANLGYIIYSRMHKFSA